LAIPTEFTHKKCIHQIKEILFLM